MSDAGPLQRLSPQCSVKDSAMRARGRGRTSADATVTSDQT